jgi:SPX domain protein involved in polyphosphate accumulation
MLIFLRRPIIDNMTNIEKCVHPNAYIYIEGKTDDALPVIERKTLKCVLDVTETDSILQLSSIFVPSMMNGTYCDMVYTTYYDYKDFTFVKNRIYNLNYPLSKCIRIRSYYFNPNTYFEIKYPGGIKIRTLIDKEYNILDENINEEYKDIIVNIIDKIKSKQVIPIFNNEYKRLSFIYKNNPSIRITIDSNIEYFYNNKYNKMDKNILELKIPMTISLGEAQEYLKEINQLANTNLTFTHFSKFEYYWTSVIS